MSCTLNESPQEAIALPTHFMGGRSTHEPMTCVVLDRDSAACYG